MLLLLMQVLGIVYELSYLQGQTTDNGLQEEMKDYGSKRS